jgi:hypothetical protein
MCGQRSGSCASSSAPASTRYWPDRDADAHQNSVERIFPKLGETATTDEILDLLEKTRPEAGV